jgi:hypothetical protein
MLGAFNFGSELLPRRAGLRSHRLVFAALTLLQRELTEIDGGPYDGVVGRGAPPRAVVRQWKAASRRRYPLLLLPERVTPGCMSSLVEGSASASVASLLRNGAAASSQRLPARIVRLKVSDGWFSAAEASERTYSSCTRSTHLRHRRWTPSISACLGRADVQAAPSRAAARNSIRAALRKTRTG